MDSSFLWCRQYGAKIYEWVDKRMYQSFLLLLQCITSQLSIDSVVQYLKI